MKITREVDIYVCDRCKVEIGRRPDSCGLCGIHVCNSCQTYMPQVFIMGVDYNTTTRRMCPACAEPIHAKLDSIVVALREIGYLPKKREVQAVCD